MVEIIRKAIRGYKYIFNEITDPRTRDWFLVAKPYQGLVLLALYLMFVFKWGPNWMKNRPAFNIDRLIILYNAFQVIACATLFINTLSVWGWGGKYQWICQPVDYTNSNDSLFEAKLTHCYFLLKICDLLDTVFFVLRKKFKQISFLHVYHHTGMVMLIWGAVTYLPGGHGTFIGVVNCFVHSVMYSYYLLSIAFPSVKNLIWVKKIVTQLQIIQFFIFVVHMTVIIFKPDCQYPRWTSAVFLPQNLFMLILFVDFYIKAYVKKPVKQKAEVTPNKNDKSNGTSSYKKTETNGTSVKSNGNSTSMKSNENSTSMKSNGNGTNMKSNGNDTSMKNNGNGTSMNDNENGLIKSQSNGSGCRARNLHHT